MDDRMGRILLIISFFLLMADLFRLQAQDIPVTALDGPVLKSDSLSRNRPRTLPPLINPNYPSLRMPDMLSPFPDGFETKEQRAARLNAQAFNGVKDYIDHDLAWYKPPKYSPAVKSLFTVLKLFLVSPYKFQDGYVPVMSASNPFMAVKTPGWAPEERPYSPEKIPPCIKWEYDIATETYKPVMVEWIQYQKDLLNAGFNTPFYNNAPIPQVPLAPGDRITR